MKTLSDKQMIYIDQYETAKEMLNGLENSCGSSNFKSQAILFRKLMRLSLNSKKDCGKHITTLLTIFNNLSLARFNLDYKQKLGFLSATLGKKFDAFI